MNELKGTSNKEVPFVIDYIVDYRSSSAIAAFSLLAELWNC